MCGRFTLTIPDAEMIAEALGAFIAPEVSAAWRPRFNIAPTDPHLVARRDKEGRLELVPARWGLVPHWATDAKSGARAINARAETARKIPLFRDAFARRRCLVPADGFFEWTGEKKDRRPVWFHPQERGLVSLGGLSSSWVDPASGNRMRTFTILTTRANDVVSPVHDRMPALLLPEQRDIWLGEDAEAAYALLGPAPHGAFVATAVSKRVNAVANDDPTLIEEDTSATLSPSQPEETTLGLFPGVAPPPAKKRTRAR